MKDIKKDYEMFSAVWKFYREYRDKERSMETWEKIINKSHEICRIYPSQLCVWLLLAIIQDFEETK